VQVLEIPSPIETSATLKKYKEKTLASIYLRNGPSRERPSSLTNLSFDNNNRIQFMPTTFFLNGLVQSNRKPDDVQTRPYG
jgi:hypothetical protein